MAETLTNRGPRKRQTHGTGPQMEYGASTVPATRRLVHPPRRPPLLTPSRLPTRDACAARSLPAQAMPPLDQGAERVADRVDVAGQEGFADTRAPTARHRESGTRTRPGAGRASGERLARNGWAHQRQAACRSRVRPGAQREASRASPSRPGRRCGPRSTGGTACRPCRPEVMRQANEHVFAAQRNIGTRG